MLWHVMSCCVMSYHFVSCLVISFCDMSYHVMSCHVMSCLSCHVMSVMSYHVMPCHVMPCHVCHIMSYHVISCHVISCHAMSCHVILHTDTPWCFDNMYSSVITIAHASLEFLSYVTFKIRSWSWSWSWSAKPLQLILHFYKSIYGLMCVFFIKIVTL